MRVLELEEHAPRELDRSEVTADEAQLLFERFKDQVTVDWPSPKTQGQWRLCPTGWVGQLPVGDDLLLRLVPKVPIHNLFGMLELAYDIDLRQFAGLTRVETLEELYESLASVLAQRVLERARRGLYRAYVGAEDRLPYLRGSLDLAEHLRTPWRVALPCRFEEHTADLIENRILAWTLHVIGRSGAITERVLPVVRMAYRSVAGFATLEPVIPQDCVDRLYNRLNQDYEILHALCRFFLEQAGPTHRSGDRSMTPFLIAMPVLFERFVARWLALHSPGEWQVEAQETVVPAKDQPLSYHIDLVLRSAAGGRPVAVLDTKYKDVTSPSNEDVNQVVVYAELMGCTDAFLVYPRAPARALDVRIGAIRVRSVVFSLDGDLQLGGRELLSTLAGGS
jgi:5-methylcytosine-specific restriction enzyme subunit McrC